VSAVCSYGILIFLRTFSGLRESSFAGVSRVLIKPAQSDFKMIQMGKEIVDVWD
jgi:hypothetical protein